ncbi:MAG TPA: sigma-70 family RNA polymerase sigma factor [Longimicrobiales bacterium]|nr:sigma-70 family RNA polymerase sigma factor [Longimicrobiales bacterium]
MDHSHTDEQLVARFLEGDGRAARALHERYARLVYAVAVRLAPDEDTAEDFAQEAWIRIFRSLGGFRWGSSLSTWMHRVAVNTALQRLRSRKVRASAEERAGMRPTAHGAATGAPEERLHLSLSLDRAVRALPDRMRTVLLLHDVQGYGHAEIGALLGIAEGTSKSQLFKARQKLRGSLAPAATAA